MIKKLTLLLVLFIILTSCINIKKDIMMFSVKSDKIDKGTLIAHLLPLSIYREDMILSKMPVVIYNNILKVYGDVRRSFLLYETKCPGEIVSVTTATKAPSGQYLENDFLYVLSKGEKNNNLSAYKLQPSILEHVFTVKTPAIEILYPINQSQYYEYVSLANQNSIYFYDIRGNLIKTKHFDNKNIFVCDQDNMVLGFDGNSFTTTGINSQQSIDMHTNAKLEDSYFVTALDKMHGSFYNDVKMGVYPHH